MIKPTFKVIDLTHTLSQETLSWSGGCGFYHDLKLDYDDCQTDVKFRVHQVKMHTGIGTHMDAPRHCFSNGKSIDELPINDFLAPCIVIDLSTQSHASYVADVSSIKKFEQQHGTIAEGSFVIIHTGWGEKWDDPAAYRNSGIFPSISKEAAEYLASKNIVGLGIDTLSPDIATSEFPVHQIILGAGKYIVENVAHANLMPPTGGYSLALPIKIQDGTEAPIRLIGLTL